MADYTLAVQWWKHSSFATERFQRKLFEILTFLARSVGGILCENERTLEE